MLPYSAAARGGTESPPHSERVMTRTDGPATTCRRAEVLARRRRRSPTRRATVAVGRALTKRARRARGLPRRRSWSSSAAPTNAGSVPAGARPSSGPWSPVGCSAAHSVQRPPRRRARTCASARLPRAQRRPTRSKRRGAFRTRVVRQPAPAADAASGSASRSSWKSAGRPASAAAGERSEAAAKAAAPRPRAWRRVVRRSGTVSLNTPRARTTRSRTVGTGTVQNDVVGPDLVPEPLAQPVDQALELGVGERVLLPAAVADRVMVVVAAGVGGLEAGRAADVDAVHEAELGEGVERPVDAGEPDRPAAVAQPLVDLLRAQAARLAPEQLQHLAARPAGAMPRAGQLEAGVIGPSGHARSMVTRIVFSMVHSVRPLLLLLSGAWALAACALAFAGGGADGGEGGRPVVIATTTQAADLARGVAGQRAQVRGVLAPNSDPHEYEVRPGDVKALARAAVIVRSGGDVDGWLAGAIDSAGADAPVVDLLAAAGPEGEDPHWWQDPRRAVRAVEAIRAALETADPAGAAAYEAGARRSQRRLEALDAAVRACLGQIPAARRTL